MNRPVAAVNPGKANRRFIMLAVVLGLLGAILVYIAFSRTKTTTGGVNENSVTVVVARQDIPARTKITASMVEVRLLSTDVRSALGYTDVTGVVNRITRFPIAANEQILSNKIVDVSPAAAASSRSLAFIVPTGQRAMAVTVKPVSTAGGLVLPGDYIDIIGVFDVDFRSSLTDPTARQKVSTYYANTLMQAKEVLAVSQTIVDAVPESTPGAEGGARARNSEAKPDPQAVTITLAVTPDEAEKLFLAEKNGDLRFTVRNFSDSEERPVTPITNGDLLPPNLPNPFLNPR
jgi:pilus assembly protein CpaB